MDNQKYQNRNQIIQKTVEAVGKRPCAICRENAETAVSFTPKDPASFGAGPDDAIYTPLCNRCALDGLKLEFLEATLLHAGQRIEI